MANVNAPFGLRPVRYWSGAPWNGKGRAYYCPSDYGTALYIGDPVVIVGDSNDAEFQGHIPGSLSEVNIATAASGTVTGVVVGVMSTTRDSPVYKPASTEAIVLVCDDPHVIFQIQGDGGGTALTTDVVGFNAQLIAGTGSTTTGNSGWAMDEGTTNIPTTTNTWQLHILNLANITGNEVADYGIWEVLINQQTYQPNLSLGIA